MNVYGQILVRVATFRWHTNETVDVSALVYLFQMAKGYSPFQIPLKYYVDSTSMVYWTTLHTDSPFLKLSSFPPSVSNNVPLADNNAFRNMLGVPSCRALCCTQLNVQCTLPDRLSWCARRCFRQHIPPFRELLLNYSPSSFSLETTSSMGGILWDATSCVCVVLIHSSSVCAQNTPVSGVRVFRSNVIVFVMLSSHIGTVVSLLSMTR